MTDHWRRNDDRDDEQPGGMIAGTDDRYLPSATIKQRIDAMLQATWPRWWSPHELEAAINVRRVPRALREMMEQDRAKQAHLRRYEEQEIDNADRKAKHKVYRYLNRRQEPTLFG
jgi:hypothetical protein